MSIEQDSGPQTEDIGGSTPEQAVDPTVYAHPEGTAATPEQAEVTSREQSRFVEGVLGEGSDVTELLESVSYAKSQMRESSNSDLGNEDAIRKVAETATANLDSDKLHLLASRWDDEGGDLTDKQKAISYLRSAMRGEQDRRGFE